MLCDMLCLWQSLDSGLPPLREIPHEGNAHVQRPHAPSCPRQDSKGVLHTCHVPKLMPGFLTAYIVTALFIKKSRDSLKLI